MEKGEHTAILKGGIQEPYKEGTPPAWVQWCSEEFIIAPTLYIPLCVYVCIYIFAASIDLLKQRGNEQA
jgi:hypothetical protein